MQELTEQEHDELMACEFVVKGEWYEGPYTTPGKLVDIDSDVGLTIVNKEDNEDYLYCLIGPSVSMKGDFSIIPGLYDALFQEAIEGIRKGVINLTDREVSKSFKSSPGQNPSSDKCAFNK